MQVYGYYDVVVVGGGASGTAAAISAAREGAKTITTSRRWIARWTCRSPKTAV